MTISTRRRWGLQPEKRRVLVWFVHTASATFVQRATPGQILPRSQINKEEKFYNVKVSNGNGLPGSAAMFASKNGAGGLGNIGGPSCTFMLASHIKWLSRTACKKRGMDERHGCNRRRAGMLAACNTSLSGALIRISSLIFNALLPY